jgi:holo-[acyl-carrier protein] synthase
VSVIGIGLDLCPIDRMRKAVERHGDRFLQRIFTPDECAYAAARGNRFEALAGRFAAKEAASKALGAPRGIGWHDVEVVPAKAGQCGPVLLLRGKAAEVAHVRGVSAVLVSITHVDGMAAAVAVAVT